MITLLTDTGEHHMAKSRGRDASISRGTLPLHTTRPVVINPLGIYIPPSPVIAPMLPRPAIKNRLLPDVTPLATPANRVAKNAAGNNLYRPATLAKEVSICTNRAVRKEVIFATGKSGRNGMKTARFTPNSKVKC